MTTTPGRQLADPDPAVVLECFVEGRPAPKGSLTPLAVTPGRKTYLGDDNSRTDPWRAAMADRFRQEVCEPAGWVRQGKVVVKPKFGYPIPGDQPVDVEVHFLFQRPARTRLVAPTGRNTGDVDKLLRCLYDALHVSPDGKKGAPVLADDGQIVDGRHKTRWVPATMACGIYVVVRTISKDDLLAEYQAMTRLHTGIGAALS